MNVRSGRLSKHPHTAPDTVQRVGPQLKNKFPRPQPVQIPVRAFGGCPLTLSAQRWLISKSLPRSWRDSCAGRLNEAKSRSIVTGNECDRPVWFLKNCLARSWDRSHNVKILAAHAQCFAFAWSGTKNERETTILPQSSPAHQAKDRPGRRVGHCAINSGRHS